MSGVGAAAGVGIVWAGEKIYNFFKDRNMGTVMAIMAGYYILNGQTFRVLSDATKWLQENHPHEGQEKNDRTQ